MTCTLCDSVLHERVDRDYFTCGGCGAYVKDRARYVSHDEERMRYTEHNNDVDDIRYQRFTSRITDAILEHQLQDQLGLDFGCGTGPVISKQLIDRGYRVKLYDPYFYPDPSYVEHQYDYIFCCEVVEHFHEPRQELERLLNLLKPGGRLYVMTHLYSDGIDFTHWYYRNDPTHVFILVKKTVDFIVAHFKLTVVTSTDRLLILEHATPKRVGVGPMQR